MSKVLENKLDEFEDRFNPQHVYCRIMDYLKDYGITKKEAREFEKLYEIYFYKPLMKRIKNDRNTQIKEKNGRINSKLRGIEENSTRNKGVSK